MTFAQLRLKHPRMRYRSYHATAGDGVVTARFEFLLEPDIVFTPQIRIPYAGAFDDRAFAPYAFHIGLMEAMSYWKAACPAELLIEAGDLSAAQIRFWQDLYVHGLGEFYFRNGIDFTQPDFLRIIPQVADVANENLDPSSVSNANSSSALFQRESEAGQNFVRSPLLNTPEDLVLVGGGKDTAVTLALLTRSTIPFQTMALNPTQASLANIQAAGLPAPLIVTRIIDPKLVALNKEGYLNGHTPFSAYLAFLGVAVASLHGNGRVVVSNERSADEGNVVYRGVEVNHQYSKSFRFESLFREYSRKCLGDPRLRGDEVPEYFSFLRPLNDIQIGMLFARSPQFFTTFRSCNAGSRTNSWCGACAKCAFTYLCLFPWLSIEQMAISFGRDFFQLPAITAHIRALVGLSAMKPFDCVGTQDEAILAIYMSIEKYERENREIPEELLKIKIDIGKSASDISRLKQVVLMHWGDTYNVPEEYLTLLRSAWASTKSE